MRLTELIDRNTTLVIGHRGARSLAPENTLAAAKAAHLCGSDMWELDVQLSRDMVPVVIHDFELSRTTDVALLPEFADRFPWNVHEFTVSELKSLDVGRRFSRVDPCGGVSTKDINGRVKTDFRGETIPTLEEALLFSKDHGLAVNVEIKDLSRRPGTSLIVGKVLSVIAELDLFEQVVLSSFNPEYVRRIRADQPQAWTGFLAEKHIPEPAGVLDELGAKAFHPKAGTISRETVTALLDQGRWVNVWTVNRLEDLRMYLDWGVTGIITDYPQRLTEI